MTQSLQPRTRFALQFFRPAACIRHLPYDRSRKQTTVPNALRAWLRAFPPKPYRPLANKGLMARDLGISYSNLAIKENAG